MKFAVYMAVTFITFFHILLVLYCVILYMVLCFVCFCLILYKCLVYSYCYVRSVLGIVFHCDALCIVSVNVYCTTATGCQPNCS